MYFCFYFFIVVGGLDYYCLLFGEFVVSLCGLYLCCLRGIYCYYRYYLVDICCCLWGKLWVLVLFKCF